MEDPPHTPSISNTPYRSACIEAQVAAAALWRAAVALRKVRQIPYYTERADCCEELAVKLDDVESPPAKSFRLYQAYFHKFDVWGLVRWCSRAGQLLITAAGRAALEGE